MIKSRTVFWISGIVVLGLSLVYGLGAFEFYEKQEEELKKEAVAKTDVVEAFVKPVAEHEQKRLEETKEKSVVFSAPVKKKVLNEIAIDPHSVPSSFLDFSVLVAAKMKAAKTDKVYAAHLFEEFESCADETELETTVAIRAYCLANAVRLQKWHPDLSRSLEDLVARTSEEVLSLVSSVSGS